MSSGSKGEHKNKIAVGQQVAVHVERITPNKIFVRLPNGQQGIIRRREVSWKDESPDLYKFVHVGQKLPAVVMILPTNDRVSEREEWAELSLKRVEFDPWASDECLKLCQRGSVVEGVVQRVRHFGAYVEVTKGVEGYLPASQISIRPIQDAQEALWPGDKVKAIVTEFAPSSYRLQLSIRAYLEQLKAKRLHRSEKTTGSSFVDHLQPADALRLKQMLGDITPSFVSPEPRRIKRILVVDDHERFRNSLIATLKTWGYGAKGAGGLKQAEAMMQKNFFDVVFLDLSLSEGSSIEWALKIKQQNTHTHIVILSGVDAQDELVEEARKAGLPLEYKPFGAEEAAVYLQTLEQSVDKEANRSSALFTSQSAGPSPPHDEVTPMNTSDDIGLIRFLERVAKQAGAEKAALFQESQDKPGEVEIVAQWGAKIPHERETLSLLWYSPIGDVLREQRRLCIDDATQKRRQARYLLQAISFRTCHGYPLNPPLLGKPIALFLFGEKPNKLSRIGPHTLAQMETFLDRWSIFRALQKAQEEMLRSHLRAGAIHDVSNTLSALDFSLQRLVESVISLQKVEDLAMAQALASEIHTTAMEVSTSIQQMENTLRIFRTLGGEKALEESESTSINAIARRSVDRHRALARHLNVHLHFSPEKDIHSTKISALRLQQVVDNVVLNAIQWSAGQPLRQVEVSTAYIPGKRLPLRILVKDSGSGIHAALQRRKIYELGFSQRKGGSGLGLFVAKALLSAIGGDIRVVESVMEVGTTFEIRLPQR